MQLTTEEVQLILDALDALDVSFDKDALIKTVMGVSMAPDETQRQKFVEDQSKSFANCADQRNNIRERIVLLKAKIIHMRDEEAARRLTEG